MAKFKKGDKVRLIKDSYYRYKYGDTGIVDENNSDNPYILWDRDNRRDFTAQRNLELIERPATGLKKIMNGLYDKFKEINLSEPEKTFRKAGVTDANGDLTEDGRKTFDAFLLNKYGMDFKTEVVDKIIEADAKKKDKK